MLRRLLGGKRYWQSLLNLAVPMAIQNLLISSFVLVDTLMVGMLGDVSLASVGMAGQWSWLLNLTMFGFSSGAAVFFAQYFGDKNKEGIKKTYGITLFFLIIAALIFAFAGLLMPKQIISIFNRDAQVLDIGSRYLKIAVFSYPAIVVNQVMGVYLRSTGKAKLPMYISFITTILNAFLDYGLIFGAFGMPELGIEGAALATCISAWVGPILLFVVMVYQKDEVVCAPISELFGFKKEDVVLFYSKAFSVIMNEVLWGLGNFVLNVIYSNLGYEYYAAMTILKTFDNIVFAFFVGINNACCVMVGAEIGGGEIKMGIKDAKRFMLFVPVFAIVLSACVVIFRSDLVSIFNMAGTIADTTLNTAKTIMIIYAIEFPVRNLLYLAITGIFRSGGDTKTGMVYDLSCLWGISVPVAAIAAFALKLPFIWVYTVSVVFEDWLKAILSVRYFFTKRWIKPVTETGKKALEEYKKELNKVV